MSKIMRKILIALDFDHTIINNNSDTFIYQLAPNREIPSDVKSLYQKTGWTKYMGEVFKYLHKHGITGSDILRCLEDIPLTDGMDLLFSSLPSDIIEFIVISDSNTIFINHILETKGLKKKFSAIFSNYAEFAENGCLQIEMYHRQTSCDLSTINLCKGDILSEYIATREKHGVEFSRIAYIGDGFNDFCPSFRLNDCDAVFPRVGFKLIKTIPQMEKEKRLKLVAPVHPWTNGKDILHVLLSWCSDINNAVVPSPRLCNPIK